MIKQYISSYFQDDDICHSPVPKRQNLNTSSIQSDAAETICFFLLGTVFLCLTLAQNLVSKFVVFDLNTTIWIQFWEPHFNWFLQFSR